ncbi:uncharacterized protein TRIADDRAFT_54844 [Trichoplax adhaerens]|uniref:Protein CLP1 homolog n=1 Tax=Trichoplax adhaerens TaxID=10228 RepID=B3RT55_TRIAD|nr:hypothetical protein TRIADDRAFT_54844 [Trichoplax adhaerens]EDV26638.1 hypothetical protein TRIADDRAFT_54844 [Trichoplax adhaerens]|eukprot:XP_002110634.1 hypothetical protein TRIADDRAFT_54844 [Trichoplax adhaerens]
MASTGVDVTRSNEDEDGLVEQRIKARAVASLPGKEYKLEAETELRIEVRSVSDAKVILLQGKAEIFGCELVSDKVVDMRKRTTCAVFTWHGCTIKIIPESVYAYVSDKTPMQFYVNLHEALEQRRCKAVENNTDGPVTMVIGPTDVGKSTLCRLLLNYAVRLGRLPTFIDLDVGQGIVSIPGTIGALHINRTITVSDGLDDYPSLVFHYGSNTPSTNVKLYMTLVSRLADSLRKYWANLPSRCHNGCIINTCGWITDVGYKIIVDAAETFKVDQIIVLDNERLYNDLMIHFGSNAEIVLAPKSGGVIERAQSTRANARALRIKTYFYGDDNSGYTPHVYELAFSDIQIFKVGGPNLPTSCLPLGMKPEDAALKLINVVPEKSLIHRILAVSAALSTDEDIVQTAVIGFVCVYDVDVNRKILKVLSPSPGALPRHILILSDLSFYDIPS